MRTPTTHFKHGTVEVNIETSFENISGLPIDAKTFCCDGAGAGGRLELRPPVESSEAVDMNGRFQM
jgi:hypothetical protein